MLDWFHQCGVLNLSKEKSPPSRREFWLLYLNRSKEDLLATSMDVEDGVELEMELFLVSAD